MSTHQQVYEHLRKAGPSTCAEISRGLGHGAGYMGSRMTAMKNRSLVTWTDDRPAKYSRAYDVLPSDRAEIKLMVAAHGIDAVRDAVTAAGLSAPEQASEETSP